MMLQLILMLTPSWESHQGMLYCFERKSTCDKWQLTCSAFEDNVGSNGLGWGRGFHSLEGPIKKEGDSKAPAGAFPIGAIFTDYRKPFPYPLLMPHLIVDETWEAIDDPTSQYYNQIVCRAQVPLIDWSSSEEMVRQDQIYELGIVVEYNMHPVIPSQGSCIFIHTWRDRSGGSAGCTIMPYERLEELAQWLEASKEPRLVQLPHREYEELKGEWGLPDINADGTFFGSLER